MRVLFVCPWVPWPLENGGQVRSYNLIRAAAQHAEVHLAVVREPGADPAAPHALKNIASSVLFFERDRPSNWRRWSRPKMERWFHSSSLRAYVEEAVRRGSFDLVHLDELFLARLLPENADIPVLQHHHKIDTLLYRRIQEEAGRGGRFSPSGFDLWKLEHLERTAARRHPHHLVCSDGDAAVLHQRYPNLKIGVLPSGIDPEVFARRTEHPARQSTELLYLGSMDYGPNIQAVSFFASEVLPRLLAKNPAIRLLVAGSRPAPEITALESKHIQILGRIDDVPTALARCTAMVVPLHIGGGTRLKIVEALAMETPVISTTIGAEDLALEHEKHLLVADTAEGFAGEVARILDDPALGRRLGAAGRRHVLKNFSWPQLGAELAAHWRRVSEWSPSAQ